MCKSTVFHVHSRCINCDLVSTRDIDIPADAEDGPMNVDEFLDSAALANMTFFCRRCDRSIATIIAVTMGREEEAA